MHWGMLTVASLCFSICTGDSLLSGGALYPSATRVRRELAATVNHTFQNSIENANLLFEIMLTGLHVEDESSAFLVRDEELASLRLSRRLAAISRDVLPRRLPDVQRLTSNLSLKQRPLQEEEFELTVLTLVYTTYRMAQTTGHKKDAWAESFVELYNAVKKDLLTT